MPNPEDVLEHAAGLVADDGPVDWQAFGGPDTTDEQRSFSNLRVLAEVRRIARSEESSGPAAEATEPSGGANPHAPAGDATEAITLWGNLQILERLSSGGFGDVYRAWDRQLHRQVALKILRRRSAADTEESIEEARRLARIEHKGVVRIYGAEVRDGVTGIWMELIHGLTLHDVVAERGALPVDETVRIGVDLCDALEAVHAANLVHQDVKPQNVMRESATGRIVLMDLGAGRRRQAHENPAPIAGTPSFMAPEVRQGVEPSPQSDLYAAGALLCFLLNGEPPVAGAPPASKRSDCPPALGAALERALSPTRADRFATAGELRAALAASLAPPAAALAPTLVTSRRPRRALWLAAAAAVAIAGIAAYQFFGPPAKPLQADVRFMEARSGRPLRSGDVISPQDQLEIEVEPSRSAFVYVLNVDDTQNVTVMFPMAEDGPVNPLRGGVPHRLPGAGASKPLGWTFSNDAGSERFLIVASRTRLSEFESELAKLPTVTLGGGLTGQPLREEVVTVLTRGVTGVAPVPKPPSAGAKSVDVLFDLARRLSGGTDSKSGVWLLEMHLEKRGG